MSRLTWDAKEKGTDSNPQPVNIISKAFAALEIQIRPLCRMKHKKELSLIRHKIAHVFMLFVFVATSMAAHGQETSIFVSTTGSDSASGTVDAPFATLSRAQQAAREAVSAGALPVTVYLHGGVYFLEAPLLFGPNDGGTAGAPVTYRSYEDESAVISGGIELNLEWQQYRDGIFSAEIPAAAISIDQLFLDGTRLHQARYPNFDADAKYFGGTSGEAISPERAKTWANPSGGYMHALHEHQWGSKHYRIADVDAAGNINFQGGWQENRGGGFDDFFRGGYHEDILFVENIFEELDVPGEWFLDEATHTLYVYPTAGLQLDKAELIGAQQLELFVVEGASGAPVHHLNFEGLTFKHTRRVFMEPYERLLRGDWSIARRGAVRFEGAEDAAIRDCLFEDLGGNGVMLSGYNRRVHVLESKFTRLGESGVCLVGEIDAVRSPAVEYSVTLPQDDIDPVPGPQTPDYPANCRVHGNLMHNFGFVGKQVAGVMISMADSITVSHNTIYECPRAAICINDGCWGGHVIEYNDVFNTVRETGDHGPFNSWGRDRFWKTATHSGRDIEPHQRARAMLDNWKTTHIRNNRFAHPGGHSWGIDLDDGASNYYLYNNLCLGMGIKFREGFFRRAENNIVVNGFGGFHIWLPEGDDVVARNIFVDDRPFQFINADPATAAEIDFNLFYNPDGDPHIGMEGEDDADFATWQGRGFDQHSIQGDPLFIDPAHGDYRVRPNSPALDLGFNNFPMNQFGVTKESFRDEVSQVARSYGTPDPDREEAVIRSGEPMTWLGATLKNLVGEAEKSAVGIGEETGVLVIAAPPGSTMAQAGLNAHDLILAIDGHKVHDLTDLLRLLGERGGSTAEVTVLGEVERSVRMWIPK
jgi:hypothetical protein